MALRRVGLVFGCLVWAGTAHATPPASATPLGSPGDWITTEDYPAAALRGGIEGTTQFRVTVDRAGVAKDCTVTGTSGSADLDSATCALVTQRARFAPAKDKHGRAIEGAYANRVHWKIPQEPSAPPALSRPLLTVDANGNVVVGP